MDKELFLKYKITCETLERNGGYCSVVSCAYCPGWDQDHGHCKSEWMSVSATSKPDPKTKEMASQWLLDHQKEIDEINASQTDVTQKTDDPTYLPTGITTVYRCSDGTIFESQSDAEDHEILTKRKIAISEIVDNNDEIHGAWRTPIKDIILQNLDALKRIP